MRSDPPRARLYLRERMRDDEGNLFELVVWHVPKGKRSPDGIRYRFAFVPRGQGEPAVLYDNHHPKGHHRHVGGEETSIVYEGVSALRAAFEEDVRKWRKGNLGGSA